MPHNSAQWITHIVEGGWATDYGKSLYATPQNGELRIPWMKTCENVRFYPDGSFGKHPGIVSFYTAPIMAPLSSTGLIPTTQVTFIYDYARLSSSVVGTKKRIAMVGSWVYDISSVSSYTLLGDLGGSVTIPPHATTFNDLLILSSGSTPKSWDQTTFQSLAGTPPQFGFSASHAGRHWAAGAAAAPSRLYYSAVGNPEDWVGAGSGSIDIDPGDGDAIVGLLSHKKELWVFKGPNRLSIHRITGTSTSDFARTTFINGISAAGQNAIFPVGNDFGFWSPRGTCHSLEATANYGDYEKAYINYPILSWCRNLSNLYNGIYSLWWQAVTDPVQNITYSVLNNSRLLDSVYKQSVLLVFDWKFRNQDNPYPRIIPLTMDYMSSIGLTEGITNSTQLYPTFGSWGGRIYQERPVNSPYYSQVLDLSEAGTATAINYRLETPALTYGPSYYTKTVMGVGTEIIDNTGLVKTNYGTLNLSVGGRNAPTQTVQFSNKGFTALDSFTLDTDQLGDCGDSPNTTEAVAGESTAFTYTLVSSGTLSQDATPDVRVKHFSALIQPSGSSMENF